MKKQINVIILAAGISRRMKLYDPRSCIPVNETTILLDDQINKIREVYKNPNITVVTGYKADKLILGMKSKGVKLVHNAEYEKTNSSGSLLCALADIPNNGNALVVPCDIFFNKKTLDYIANIHYSDGSCILYDNAGRLHKSKVGVLIDKSKVCNFTFTHKDKFTGITFFNASEIALLLKLLHKPSYKKRYLFEIVNEMINSYDATFHAHCPPLMKIIEINSIRDTKSKEFKEINK